MVQKLVKINKLPVEELEALEEFWVKRYEEEYMSKE